MKLLRIPIKAGKNAGRTAYYRFMRAGTADRLGVRFVRNWRHVNKVGVWAALDDGWIGKVRGYSTFKNHQYPVVKFGSGTFLGTPGFRADSQLREDRHHLAGKREKYDDPNRPLSNRDLKAVAAWFKLDFDVFRAYSTIARGRLTDTKFRRRARKFFERAHIREAIFKVIREEIRDFINAEYLAEKLRKLLDSEDTSDTVKMKGIAEGADWVGLKEKSKLPGDSEGRIPPGRMIQPGQMEELEGARHKQLEPGRPGGDSGGARKPDEGVVPGHGEVRKSDTPEHPETGEP